MRTWTGRLRRIPREWIRRWHHSHSGRGGQRACSPIVTAPPSQKARTRAQLDRGRHAAVPCRLAARVPRDSVRPASGWPARRDFRRIPTRAISGCRRRWSGPGASPSPGSSARSGGRCRRRRAASWVWTRHCATPPAPCTASPASVQALHHGFQWIAERLNRVPGFVFECSRAIPYGPATCSCRLAADRQAAGIMATALTPGQSPNQAGRGPDRRHNDCLCEARRRGEPLALESIAGRVRRFRVCGGTESICMAGHRGTDSKLSHG